MERELWPQRSVPGSGLSASLPLCSATCWSKWKGQRPSLYYKEPSIHGPSQTLEGTPVRASLRKLLTWTPRQAAEAPSFLPGVGVGVILGARGEEFPGGGHPSGIPHSCVNGRTMVTASGGRQRRPAAFCVSLDLPPTHSSSELYFYSEGLCIYYI